MRSWPAGVPMPMRRSFDGTLGEKAITTEDMALFAARFRQLHAEPDGPLAIVLPPAKHAGLVPLLGAPARCPGCGGPAPVALHDPARRACLARRPGDGTVRRMIQESGSPDAARRRLAVRIAVLLQGWERHRRDPNRREAFHVMEALRCLRTGRYNEGKPLSRARSW